MSYEFKFPDIGEGLTNGKILEFKLKKDDLVKEGDILAIVETDKVVAEIASPKNGKLIDFGCEVGEKIDVGETLAYIEVEKEEISSKNGDISTKNNDLEPHVEVIVGKLDAETSLLPSSDEGLSSSKSANYVSSLNKNNSSMTTPAVRRFARDLDVDLTKVKGSGPKGRVVREDVEDAAKINSNVTSSSIRSGLVEVDEKINASNLPANSGSDFAFPLIDDPLVKTDHLPLGQTVELTILRKTIAHTMETSRKIPAATIFDIGVVDDLVELRAKVNEGRDVRVSFQPFFMKALATALRRYPVLNAHFNPVSEELTVFKDINIGIAVNTQAGIMVPVIHNVENKTIREIDNEMKLQVERAKSRQINIEDLRGGTFSLTNFGPFGGLYASPMIYPPQVAIIGAGRIHQVPTVIEGSVLPAWSLPVSLSFDHRVVDGVPAAEFSAYFLALLRAPQELFVSM